VINIERTAEYDDGSRQVMTLNDDDINIEHDPNSIRERRHHPAAGVAKS
jgi:hypothetical protein